MRVGYGFPIANQSLGSSISLLYTFSVQYFMIYDRVISVFYCTVYSGDEPYKSWLRRAANEAAPIWRVELIIRERRCTPRLWLYIDVFIIIGIYNNYYRKNLNNNSVLISSP